MQKNLRLRVEKYMIETIFSGNNSYSEVEFIIKFTDKIKMFIDNHIEFISFSIVSNIVAKNYKITLYDDIIHKNYSPDFLIFYLAATKGISIDFKNKKIMSKFLLLFYNGDEPLI